MSSTEEQEQRVFYITHKLELLILLIIVLIIAVCGILGYCYNKTHISNVYRIYMSDVDGLIIGSPVRMMGIEVGHVTKVKPLYDEVYVKFVLHDKNLKLPQGTSVTVEFSGMTGSKSLELYLPDGEKYIDKNAAVLQVNPPKRLHEAAGLLYEMFKELDMIIKTSSLFGKELRRIDIPNFERQNGNIEDFIKYSDGVVDESQNRIEELGRKINHDRK